MIVSRGGHRRLVWANFEGKVDEQSKGLGIPIDH